jgi:DNA polymerase-1
MFGIFKAREGYEYWQLDLKQAEMRLAASLTKDPRLLEIMAQEDDIYIQMAVRMWNDATRRQDAKSASLASIYEIGVSLFASENGLSEKEAGEILFSFRKTFPILKGKSKTIASLARLHRSVHLWDDRVIFLRSFDPEYKAFNYSVQGGVAAILRKGMLQIEKEFPGMLVLQIHDSVIMEVHIPERKEILSRASEILSNAYPNKNIKLDVDKEKFQL